MTPDFLDRVRDGDLETPVIEAIARKTYETRCLQKFGKAGDYDALAEEGKEENRFRARYLRAILSECKYSIEPSGLGREAETSNGVTLDADHIMEIWHDMWMRTRLLEGWDKGSCQAEGLRLHPNITHYNEITEINRSEHSKWQQMSELVAIIPKVLNNRGYKLVRTHDDAWAADSLRSLSANIPFGRRGSRRVMQIMDGTSYEQ